MYQLPLVQAVDRLGQCVVMTVAFPAHGRFDARLGQSFAVPDGHVLRSSVAWWVKASVCSDWRAYRVWLQCIQYKVCSHGTALAPTHDTPGKHSNHKSHMIKFQPCAGSEPMYFSPIPELHAPTTVLLVPEMIQDAEFRTCAARFLQGDSFPDSLRRCVKLMDPPTSCDCYLSVGLLPGFVG